MLAMFRPSWKAPLFTAPSPKNEIDTLFLLNKLIEYPAPQDCKIFGPTIPLVPISPISGLKRCMLPPLPFEQPVSFPNNSDISSKGSKPFAKA